MTRPRFVLGFVLALVASSSAAVPQGSMVGDEEAAAAPEVALDLSFLSDPTHGAPSLIVAKVNDEIITRHEVLEKIKVQLQGLRASYGGDAYRRKAQELWEKTLTEQVEERVLLQAARKEGVDVTWKDVDKSLDDEIKRAGSRERFDQNLAQTGRTLDAYREHLRKQLIMRELIYRLVGIKDSAAQQKSGKLPDDPIATPGEIHEYYEKHLEDFFIEEKVQVQQIILKFNSDDTRQEMTEIARSLERQMSCGASFDALARWYTAVRAEDNGIWDWAPRGSLPPEFEDRVFSMKPGDITPMLESGNTLRLVRLLSRQDPRQRSFSEVQEEIKKIIQNKRIYDGIDRVKRDLLRNQYIWPPDVIRPK